jgi:hypothetical protein
MGFKEGDKVTWSTDLGKGTFIFTGTLVKPLSMVAAVYKVWLVRVDNPDGLPAGSIITVRESSLKPAKEAKVSEGCMWKKGDKGHTSQGFKYEVMNVGVNGMVVNIGPNTWPVAYDLEGKQQGVVFMDYGWLWLPEPPAKVPPEQEWKEVKGERSRTYHFPEGHTYTVKDVVRLCVRPSGHCLETKDGAKLIIPGKFLAITINADKWSV